MKDLHIRFAKEEDTKKWMEWFLEPGILRWFPMCNKVEVEDAIRILETYIIKKAVLSAVYKDELCGVATIYLQSFEKLKHQALFVILVDQKFRNKGIGTFLLEEVMKVAKENFHLEYLHLEVYESNPAIHLYERAGFKRIGFQKNFLKDKDRYYGKNFMQRQL